MICEVTVTVTQFIARASASAININIKRSAAEFNIVLFSTRA